MSVLQRLSLLPNERLDTADARFIEASGLNDWRFFLQGFYSPKSYILSGFEISNYSTIFSIPGFKLTFNDVVLFHSQATTQAAGFYVFAGTEQDTPVSLSPSATNFVEADLSVSSGTPDVRAFWDQAGNGGAGGEFNDTVETVINLDLAVSANITGFTTGKIPLYKVVTNAGGVVTSVTDCRNLFFRLGTGGDSPDPTNNFAWPSLPNPAHARLETSITATSATTTNAPFQGGDKNLKTFKDWMDAVMSSIKEIKGSPYWYSPGGANVAAAYQNAALIVFAGGTWEHNPPYLTTTGSVTSGSPTLSSLGSTAGIVSGDVVVGVDIPDSPVTTVSAPFGSSVTMSASAIGSNGAESVSFRRGVPGLLTLLGGSVIHRLGFVNSLFLDAGSFDLNLHPALYVLAPTTDTAVSYGPGDDASTPVVPKAVSIITASTITVATGGNYVSTGGKILVHGQEFTYTSYTPGTGLFTGVSPDPNGFVVPGDYVYQLDTGGVGYYHYSAQSVVPGVVGGVSSGAERTMWLAFFDGANTIELRNGDVLPGEVVNVGDETIQNILEYVGMADESVTFPQYTVSATGAKNNETNYNSTAGENLTTRLSKITSMVADKAQDKEIGFLASGFTKIVNTISGANQLITFTGGGSIVVAMPGSTNNGSVGLGGTLTLAALQAAYFTVDRNAVFTISSLSALTVANIASVPIGENTFVFAYRGSGTEVYLWDGTTVPVGSLPTLSTLDSIVNQDRSMKLINGGTWSWNSGTSTLTWSSAAQVEIPGLADSVNNIVAASAVLADGEAAYVSVNRTGPGGNLAVTVAAIASVPMADDVFIVARRTGSDVLIGRSFRLVNSESKTLDAGLSDQNKTFIGITTEGDSSPNYSFNNFISDGDSLITASGKLDDQAGIEQAKVLTQERNANQDRNLQLISGGTWSWDGTTLTWSAVAKVVFPGALDSWNQISAGSLALADGQVGYVYFNRVGPGGTIAPAAISESSLSPTDDVLIFARRIGTTVEVGTQGQMLLKSGDARELFAGGTGTGTGASLQAADGFQALITDTFAEPNTDATSAVRSTETNATYDTSVANHKFYKIKCDKTKTVTTVGTGFTLSGAPSFTIAAGDIIYSGSAWRRIASISSQTVGVLDVAFSPNLTTAACMVSQAVWTKDIVNFGTIADGNLFKDIFGAVNINQINLDYEDSLSVGDAIWDVTSTARVVGSASNNGVVADVALPTSDTFAPIFTRPTGVNEILNYPLLANANRQRLFIAFFCNPNNASVTAQANLLKYDASLYPETPETNGGFLDSAFCMSDSTGTPNNCSNPTVVVGKTRVQLNFDYVPGINSGFPDGDLEVIIEGNSIPRFYTGIVGAYWKEVSGSTSIIELYADLSGFSYSIHVRRRQGVLPSITTVSVAAHGSRPSPITVTPAGGITATSEPFQQWFIQGVLAGGAQNVTAVPQITAGTTPGIKLQLTNVNGTDYSVFHDGDGLSLNGSWPPMASPDGASIQLSWDGVFWSEDGRR